MYPYILHIPTELQEKILLYMNYDEITRLRLVEIILSNYRNKYKDQLKAMGLACKSIFNEGCPTYGPRAKYETCPLWGCYNSNSDSIVDKDGVCKVFNKVCQSLLNKGFVSVERFHGSCLRNVKSQLPRRESERRNHSLARHCDILNSIETRLSLLSMTFIKYVELNLCCFIPGKVIDEIYRVLRIIRQTRCAPRAHEILQELRDISSMAMEHFDEKIVPTLKQKMNASSMAHQLSLSPSAIEGAMTIARNPREGPLSRSLRNELSKIQQSCKVNSLSVRRELSDMKLKALNLEKRFLEMNHLMTDQNAKIAEQEGRINEMNRKLVEYDRRFSELACTKPNTTANSSSDGASIVKVVASTSVQSMPASKSKSSSSAAVLQRGARAKLVAAINLDVTSSPARRLSDKIDSPTTLEAFTTAGPASCTRSKRRLKNIDSLSETQSPKRKSFKHN